jgi:hypothetical protein
MTEDQRQKMEALVHRARHYNTKVRLRDAGFSMMSEEDYAIASAQRTSTVLDLLDFTRKTFLDIRGCLSGCYSDRHQ